MKSQTMLILGASLLYQLISCKSSSNDTSDDINRQVQHFILFVGTYTSGSGESKSEGIYVYRVNFDSMKFKLMHTVKASNPSYLCLSQDKKYLYCVNENGAGEVTAFRIDSAYRPAFINTVSSQGSYPCYISLDNTEKYVLVANYGSGNFVLFGKNAGGGLTQALSAVLGKGKGPNTSRQEGPHAHMIVQNSFNKMVYATDLGTDRVYIFSIDTLEQRLTGPKNSYATQPGAGPRHLAIHPTGKWMYILSELNGTIEVVNIDSINGSLKNIQLISTLEKNESRYPGSADIHITPDGRYLYATNRGEINNIACYAVDSQSGQLSLQGHVPSGGRTPRNFCLDPTGHYLLVANQDSNTIVVFLIQNNGLLKEVHTFNAPMPVCLKFL